ncbi:MAG TPA: vitamin K epoxide reductase [Actinobacteria bacterium]|jgi:uncharacterized membrane protein|nr:vitamin K epoxide reductase [Actinomycetota bacterium]
MPTDIDADLEASEVPEAAAPGRHIGAYVEMLISSVIGLFASLVLSIEAVTLAANPAAVLSCDFSSKISCGVVAETWQAQLFGWPNSFLGLIAEPVVITVAVAALGGVRFPRWFMLTAQAIYTLGFVFAWWLFYQSYFVIGALCPWCLLITVTTTLVFMSMSRVNILDGNFGTGIQRALTPALSWWVDVWLSILIIAALAAAVIFRYL